MKPIKIKQFTNLKDFPIFFERYEVFIILLGIGVAFLLAGTVFYQKAYKVTVIIPEAVVDVPRVNTFLFEKTVEEIEQKKRMAPDLPIIDPFQ